MENTGGAPTQAATQEPTGQESQPDFANMTGEQAKAWVEAQKKGEKSPPNKIEKKLGGNSDPYLADKPKQDTQEAVKEAVAEAKRRLKIDDEEIDEEEVIKIYKERRQHQQVANKTLHEGKAARQQAEEFVKMLKDPQKFWDVAKKLGHDPRNLSEKLLVGHIEEEMMDPRERKLKEVEAKLRHLEDLDRQEKEAVEKKRLDGLRSRFADDYTRQFTEALKTTNIPATKGTVAEMAKYIARSAAMGFQMTAAEAAQLVREDILEAQKRLIGDSDGETLIKLLGEDVANKIRKYDTGRLRDPNPPRVAPEDQGKPREKRIPNKRMTPREWREFNRR